jgi:hypothetical protein
MNDAATRAAQASRATLIAVAAVAAAVITGCSASPSQPAASASSASSSPAAAPSSVPASTPAATAAAATAPATPATPQPSGTASSPAPTLGQLAGVFAQGQGFGQVEPSTIFNGGDPTGLVTNVVWTSWGGAQATAAGTAEYVAPNQSVAQGTEETATVVAFDLGTCGGKYMYQAVEWYFPQHSQAFNPNTYENICTGSYAGTP